MESRMEQAIKRFKTDYDVVLECIHEVYGLEKTHLYLGKDFRKTMIFPFMKMLERHCSNIKVEMLHKVLWEAYQDSKGEQEFLGKAEILLKPYCEDSQIIKK